IAGAGIRQKIEQNPTLKNKCFSVYYSLFNDPLFPSFNFLAMKPNGRRYETLGFSELRLYHSLRTLMRGRTLD
ncbi:MAG: hypothetical protein JXA77_07025, partial [Bacteroidales bacterium]|nr:hypothetical protein [Bacteroidales bacterium]